MIIRKICLLFLLFLVFSCDYKTDCSFFEKIRREENCVIIVDIPPRAGSVYFNTKGRSLDNSKECNCDVESRWWAIFSEKIKKGDTIIKRKGELIFEIRKKDTILKYKWECKNGLYLDIPPEISTRK